MQMRVLTQVRLAVTALAVLVAAGAGAGEAGRGAARPPNILWLTCEDIGPHLGCYGDRYAVTPALDALAARGVRYRTAWSNAPVCAPARTAIITGVYPTALGAEHMRSGVPLPAGMPLYPVLMRNAGYYCTNNSKEDYNLEKTGAVWDESSNKAHWKHRREGQPFFAIFNFTVTHESGIRRRPHRLVHDPARAPLPAYHPDTPEVRHDWAQYHDNITAMDAMAAARLAELEEAGLADDTIVFFYGDHGSGMPRHKRSALDSGLRVPMIVFVPEKYRALAPGDYAPGGESRRLVSFVDLAPTLLSLAGVAPPAFMQGHAFMGPHEAAPREYVFGFRGRMDERYDMVRSVRDQRYIYVRHFMPHLPGGQHVKYMFATPTTRVWKELFDQGKLDAVQSAFWRPREAEELYDLDADPDETRNLAALPAHRAVLERLRAAGRAHALATRDLGFLPEDEIHRRAGEGAPYTYGQDVSRYPLEHILRTAELAASRDAAAAPALAAAMKDADSAVRTWAALGMCIRGAAAVDGSRDALRALLTDPEPAPRIAAAWALGAHGGNDDLAAALPVLVELASRAGGDLLVSLQALTAIDALGAKAAPALDTLRKLPAKAAGRAGYCLAPLLEKIIGDLEKARGV